MKEIKRINTFHSNEMEQSSEDRGFRDKSLIVRTRVCYITCCGNIAGSVDLYKQVIPVKYAKADPWCTNQ